MFVQEMKRGKWFEISLADFEALERAQRVLRAAYFRSQDRTGFGLDCFLASETVGRLIAFKRLEVR